MECKVPLDLDELENVESLCEMWQTDVMRALKVDDVELMYRSDKFMPFTKPVITPWLAGACEIMERQKEMINQLKELIELLKTDALADTLVEVESSDVGDRVDAPKTAMAGTMISAQSQK